MVIDPVTLADRFAAIIRQWLTPDELDTAVWANRINRRMKNGFCATQDFCDANQAMIDAWVACDGSPDEMGTPEAVRITDKAWEIAQTREFGLDATAR